MNLYNYWLKLKQLYPAAVAAAVAHFRETHREAWRTHFKDPDNILSWLDTCQIQIQTFKKTPPKNRPNSHSPGDGLIRFELSAPEESTTTAHLFTTRDAALYDAIERAFRIIEQRTRRSTAQNSYLANQHRRIKQKGAGQHWGHSHKP